MPEIYVLNKFQDCPYQGLEMDTTSRGLNKDLSPFYLGPVQTYEPGVQAMNVENYWQFSKLYSRHAYAPAKFEDIRNPLAYNPSELYWEWRNQGWASPRAQRYPMGKGAKPLYSLYKGQKLGYIDARKKIYVPAYARAVIGVQSYADLHYAFVHQQRNIILRDFDGYDYTALGMPLQHVINNAERTMGHAFVIAMMLKGVINECVGDHIF